MNILEFIIIIFISFTYGEGIETGKNLSTQNFYENFHNFTIRKSEQILPKCCSYNEILNYGGKCEQNFGNFLQPDILSISDNYYNITFETNLMPNCSKASSISNCVNSQELLFYPSNSNLTENSELQIIYEDSYRAVFASAWRKTKPGQFCLEKSQNNCTTLLYCQDTGQDEKLQLFSKRLAIIWSTVLIILPFMALINSFIIQRNWNGHILTAYFVNYFLCKLTVILQVLRSGVQSPGCDTLDFLQKFFCFSSNVAITCVNFDLWWSFICLKMKRPISTKGSRKFCKYLIFTLVIPLIPIIGTTIYGLRNRTKGVLCIYYEQSLNFAIQIPIFPLVILNCLLFVHTWWIIRGLRRDSKFARVNLKNSEKSFTIFSKLFILNGPNWVFRAIVILLIYEDLYLKWWGLLMEILNFVPFLVFFIQMILHPEFKKWFKNITGNTGTSSVQNCT